MGPSLMSGRRRWRYPASLAARSFPRCFGLQRAVADSMSCGFPDSAPGGGDWSAAGRACGFCGGGECHIPGPVAAGCRNNRSYDSTERSLSRRIGVVVSVCCAGATSRGRRAGGLTRAPAIESETADIGRFFGTEIETQGFADYSALKRLRERTEQRGRGRSRSALSLYSPEGVEEKFSEVHRLHSPGPTPMSLPDSDRLPEGIIWVSLSYWKAIAKTPMASS